MMLVEVVVVVVLQHQTEIVCPPVVSHRELESVEAQGASGRDIQQRGIPEE